MISLKGWLATKYGGKKVLGYGVLITAVLTLLTPLAANGGTPALVILRILQGLAEVSPVFIMSLSWVLIVCLCNKGVSYPATHALVTELSINSYKREIKGSVLFLIVEQMGTCF